MDSESLISSIFWAAVGGLIVLIGLIMEQVAEKGWFNNISEYRILKRVKLFGEWFVIIGVFVEVVIAGVTAKNELKIWRKANEADLHNQPIYAMSGYIMVLMRPADTNEFSKKLEKIEEPPSLFKVKFENATNDLYSVSLEFGRAFEMGDTRGGISAFFSQPDNISESISTFGGENLIRFDIYFGENQGSFCNNALTPSDLDAVNILLPIGGEIVSGTIEISIDHDFVKKSFNIPQQSSFGKSISCVVSNGGFAPIEWRPQIRDEFKKSEAIRLKQDEQQFAFLARGKNLEAKANGDKTKGRTIINEQTELFIKLLRDYPRIPIKVFVKTNDFEALQYARKIREILDASDYGGNGGGIVNIDGEILIGGKFERWQSTPHTLVFVAVPNTKYGGLTVPIANLVADIRPTISAGFTNDPVIYALGKLACVKWAFSGIGLDGFFIANTNLLMPGEVGIIVPTNAH